ncbi:MAG TPA: hypothetical protein VGF70_03590 [Solirubrobacteraceae bacterium]
MRPRWGLALVVLVALVAALLYALTRGGAGPQRSPEFGADMGVLFQDHDPPAVVNRALASAAAAGLGVARVAPLWELTEPTPPQGGHHRYDWRYDDFIARELAGHGFRWVAVLAFAPAWASVQPGVLHSAPRVTAAYAAYAAAVARRYRGLISAFEVWNEEDLPVFWRPAPDPVAYARLYEAARAAIHRVDPGVPVLVGGLAGGHTRFLTDLLQQPLLRGRMDGLAIHTYAATPARMLAQIRAYRLRLTGASFGAVPLYVTEYGWSSRPIARSPKGFPVPAGSYAPPSVRPGFIVQAARDVLASGCNVRMAVFYAWVTPQRTPVTLYQWYGVAAPDGAGTPASRAISREAGLTRVRAAPAGSCLPQG